MTTNKESFIIIIKNISVRACICIRYYSQRKSIGIKIIEFVKAKRDFDVWKMKRLGIHDGIIVAIRKNRECENPHPLFKG